MASGSVIGELVEMRSVGWGVGGRWVASNMVRESVVGGRWVG